MGPQLGNGSWFIYVCELVRQLVCTGVSLEQETVGVGAVAHNCVPPQLHLVLVEWGGCWSKTFCRRSHEANMSLALDSQVHPAVKRNMWSLGLGKLRWPDAILVPSMPSCIPSATGTGVCYHVTPRSQPGLCRPVAFLISQFQTRPQQIMTLA